MAGEKNLDKLLASMAPQLLPAEYVFCTVKQGKYGDFAELSPIASYLEAEGLTLIITKESAEKAGFNYESLFRCITLMVHSSLDAVGLTAVVASKLAEKQISANIVAAFYHDHIFVQTEKAIEALNALAEFVSQQETNRETAIF